MTDHSKNLRSVLFLSRHAKSLASDCPESYRVLIESLINPVLHEKPKQSESDHSSIHRSEVCGNRLPGNREDKGQCSITSLDENIPISCEECDLDESSFSALTGTSEFSLEDTGEGGLPIDLDKNNFAIIFDEDDATKITAISSVVCEDNFFSGESIGADVDAGVLELKKNSGMYMCDNTSMYLY